MKNRYRVPKSEWRKWGPEGQRMFNGLYGLMLNRPELFNHPQAPKHKREHWKTIVWNIMWLAADEVRAIMKEATPA